MTEIAEADITEINAVRKAIEEADDALADAVGKTAERHFGETVGHIAREAFDEKNI